MTFYSSLIETMPILYRFLDNIASYLSKVADFFWPTPSAFGALVGGHPGRIR